MQRMRPCSIVLAGLLAVRAVAEPSLIALSLPSGKALKVEVMVKDEDRQLGLMFRPSLPDDHGMLFVFSELGFHLNAGQARREKAAVGSSVSFQLPR